MCCSLLKLSKVTWSMEIHVSLLSLFHTNGSPKSYFVGTKVVAPRLGTKLKALFELAEEV